MARRQYQSSLDQINSFREFLAFFGYTIILLVLQDGKLLFISFHISSCLSSIFSISFHNFPLYFPNRFTIQLGFLPYFSYLFTIQLTFLLYFPYLFTIFFFIFQIFSLFNLLEERQDEMWNDMKWSFPSCKTNRIFWVIPNFIKIIFISRHLAYECLFLVWFWLV
jgi:hypothetical protein